MMLDIKIASKANDFSKYLPLGGIIGSVFIFKILQILLLDFATPVLSNNSFFLSWIFCLDKIANIELLGQVLYTNFFLYFLISGLLLLVAMIGSIVLTLRFGKTVKNQIIFKQLSRNAGSAIFLVKN